MDINVNKQQKNDAVNDKKLKALFTPEIIKQLKDDKDLITFELLETMRSFGNVGKKLAIEILDIKKDLEKYYLDAFGNRCAFDGNRRLKRQFTKFKLSQIHKDEIVRCHNDIKYFKDNYIQIKTKTGTNFPEMRVYQNEFLEVLDDDDNESVIGLMGRQCCAKDTSITVDGVGMSFEQLFKDCKNEK